jgi:hypothetical protein
MQSSELAPQPAHGALTLVPVSPAIAKLLHELQGQIIREATDAAAVLPPGAVVILPSPAERASSHILHSEGRGFRCLDVTFADGCSMHLQTPCCADPEWGSSRPGRWYGREERRDTSGSRWEHFLPDYHVMDDFGALVPMGGAQ